MLVTVASTVENVLVLWGSQSVPQTYVLQFRGVLPLNHLDDRSEWSTKARSLGVAACRRAGAGGADGRRRA